VDWYVIHFLISMSIINNIFLVLAVTLLLIVGLAAMFIVYKIRKARMMPELVPFARVELTTFESVF
jgi:hypothetical protein